MSSTKQKAVIYCRVSSQKQVKKGDGLGSQETRCREYAKHKNYQITEVFRDEGISGSLINRPSMQDMLSYLKQHKKKQEHIVIIDDISRLARDLEAHIQLRTSIGDAGGKLESPSIEFGEDSDSKLVENLLASVSQHHRQKNAEQVKHRMRARVLNGYWVFSPPIGYRYERVSGHGKLLVRDEPTASIVEQALSGFASGRFETVTEVKRFLENFPEYPHYKDGEVHFQRAKDLLCRVLYTGHMDVPQWDISLHPAKHEALISFEDFQKIQERLDGRAKAPIKANIQDDFPLRGFVTCGCCDRPLTSCWSTGRTTKYPYYLCSNKKCDEYGKSIKREVMEAGFLDIVKSLQPSPKTFYLALDMFEKLWQDRQVESKGQAKAIKQQITLIDRKVGQFLDRVLEVDNPILLDTYEAKIRDLQEEKVYLSEKVQMCGRPLASFEDTFRTAIEFLGNPHKLWESNDIDQRRMLLRMAFTDKITYDRNQGFRTAAMSQPFSLLEDLHMGKKEMVEGAGFEPAYAYAGGVTIRCL
ncbi:MAG: recombinase family protein [Gammaproteobacteria bacterium]|nr:recombinase family protein [Gammaproteobacteria bacterium]